jgi:hypothetical protein
VSGKLVYAATSRNLRTDQRLELGRIGQRLEVYWPEISRHVRAEVKTSARLVSDGVSQSSIVSVLVSGGIKSSHRAHLVYSQLTYGLG